MQYEVYKEFIVFTLHLIQVGPSDNCSFTEIYRAGKLNWNTHFVRIEINMNRVD